MTDDSGIPEKCRGPKLKPKLCIRCEHASFRRLDDGRVHFTCGASFAEKKHITVKRKADPVAEIEAQLREVGFDMLPRGSYARSMASAWRAAEYAKIQKHPTEAETPETPNDCKFKHMIAEACKVCKAARPLVDEDGDAWLFCNQYPGRMPLPPHELDQTPALPLSSQATASAQKPKAEPADDDSGQVRVKRADYIAFARYAAKRYAGYKRFMALALREALGLPVQLPTRVRKVVTDNQLDAVLSKARKRQSIVVNIHMEKMSDEEKAEIYRLAKLESTCVNGYIIKCIKKCYTQTPTNPPTGCNISKKSESVIEAKNGMVAEKNGDIPEDRP